jgi:hypothetical protein
MTTYLQGTTATVYVQWYEYAGGPLVNVNNVTVTISPLAGGAAVIGPTAVGVTNPSTGLNVYNWTISGSQAAGDYLILWAGTDAGTGTPVSASEIVTVATAAAAASPTGLCAPWDPIWCVALPTGSEAISGYAVQAASEALWAATAQRFGLCTETIRPCRRDCYGRSWPFADAWWEYGTYPRPLLYQGVWYNIGCGQCPGTCSCTALEEALLPGVVYDIIQVKVDGVPLASSAYRVDNNRLLVRTDGGTWPTCQDLAAADTEVDTWSVTVRFGEPVPILGQQAVGELAAEIARACLGEDCRLPKNITQLVRQGVTITFPEGQNLADRLYFPRLFIETFNPKRLPALPQVYDVDGPTFRRTGT